MAELNIVASDEMKYTNFLQTMWKKPYVFLIALSGILSGLQIGVTGFYANEDPNKDKALQDITLVFFVFSNIIGACIGARIDDILTTKEVVMVADFFFFVGTIGTYASEPVQPAIVTWQVVIGISVGMNLVASPIYLSEVSPPRIRGALVSVYGISITSGQYISYLINIGDKEGSGNWYWMRIVPTILPVVQCGLFYLLSESPYRLLKENKLSDARRLMEKLYDAEEVDAQMGVWKNAVDKDGVVCFEKPYSKKIMGAFKNGEVKRAMTIGFVVQLVSHFSGYNAIIYYKPTIIKLATCSTGICSLTSSITLSLIGPFLSLFIIDRWGRTRVMAVTLTIIAIVFFYLALIPYNHPKHLGFVPIILLECYSVVYYPGTVTTPWVVNAEVYPLPFRGFGGGLSVSVNAIASGLINFFFVPVTKAIGPGGTFMIYCCLSLFGLVLIYFFVPETKGLPLGQVGGKAKL